MILKIEIPEEIANPILEKLKRKSINPQEEQSKEIVSDEDLMIGKISATLKSEAGDLLAETASQIASDAARETIKEIEVKKGK